MEIDSEKQRKRLGRSIEMAANWLDSYRSGWHNRIDFNKLDMSMGNSCICGQLGLDWQFGQRQVDTPEEVFKRESEVEFWKFEVERRIMDETVKRPKPVVIEEPDRGFVHSA